ncbi:MAG TPA: NrfD/PsrC family molybdoenzyme membrane anchor subunit [Actinophytocola sp.]|uniref:NrfD/PsrC family molybdoenzyme membrane anchor subunit n=1 Tax=Actinophytocola sp. TaxID=1872138 RepID=UPI002DDDAC9D|nr:NrfD/PsrC family molybdoenzyme membrane anchor subunit [Actinophytocola sp.]HEV2780044.1 NrfD/PsrC family molybdoenzyme membrane anchor subunit [Actinophytocola sp.]
MMSALAEPAQHFARSPDWTWYILAYFFFAGLSGGSYVIASLFRLRGDPADEPAARIGYYVSFAALLPCPVMLILDLGTPLRFWHMLWNTTPGEAGLNFEAASPMSVGVWALLIYGAFATVSFVDSLVRDGRLRWPWLARLLGGAFGKVVVAVGAILGLFIAGYTGVLLSVSNQPVWSDTWALGGLFLASGLSGSAALMLFLLRYRRAAEPSSGPLIVSERLYAVLELALIVIFAITLIPAGAFDLAFGYPWILLWLVALAGLVPGIGGLLTSRLAVTPEGVTVPVQSASAVRSIATPLLILAGVLALRAAVIFSIQ